MVPVLQPVVLIFRVIFVPGQCISLPRGVALPLELDLERCQATIRFHPTSSSLLESATDLQTTVAFQYLALASMRLLLAVPPPTAHEVARVEPWICDVWHSWMAVPQEPIVTQTAEEDALAIMKTCRLSDQRQHSVCLVYWRATWFFCDLSSCYAACSTVEAKPTFIRDSFPT